MQAYLDLVVKETCWEAEETEKQGVLDFLRKTWNTLRSTIAKYVKYDKDAIFKDRNWPYLWS
jgi:hypothetical protein